MTEEQSDERTCDLHLLLVRQTGTEVSYDTQDGVNRSLTLTGWVDDPYRWPSGRIDEGSADSAFHDKRIRLKMCAPPDSGWLDNVRESLGDKSACGAASVEAGVEPERFELQGEMEEIEAIQVRLDVTEKTLEAIWRQVWPTDDHRRLLSAKVVLSGNAIPDVDSLLVWPQHLDISQKREYAVKGFEIHNTRIIDTMRGRVREIARTSDEGYGAYISVLLSQVRYELHTEYGIYYGISCTGRIINAWEKPYDGAYVSGVLPRFPGHIHKGHNSVRGVSCRKEESLPKSSNERQSDCWMSQV